MVDLMSKKNYDLTEITRLLLEMRENCIPKAGNAYEDPNRAEKYEALNAAIDLINNPSLLTRWISVKDRLPDTQHIMLVCTKNRNGVPKIAMASYHDGFGWCGSGGRWGNVTHWMPLPETPKEE